MSNDTVDDLHAAEDFAGTLAELLRRALDDGVFSDSPEYKAEAKARVAEWAEYCRPGCGAVGDDSAGVCGDSTCGCPCGHADGEDDDGGDDDEPTHYYPADIERLGGYDRVTSQLSQSGRRAILHGTDDPEHYCADHDCEVGWGIAPPPDDDGPHAVHTTCAVCSQDIEGEPGGTEWRDRGGNTGCVPYYAFDPSVGGFGYITPPDGTEHRPVPEA